MILQIKTHNYHMIEGSIPVALIYKISYKAMISAFSTQHKFQSEKDKTLLLQTDLSKANTVIPKPIQWKDINLPDEWILEGATAPVIPKQLESNTELQNVTQYSDGKVKLSFRRSTSSRFSDKDSRIALPTVKSPPDLTIDNKPVALNQSRFNASSVYEWNIDGMSEYNILGLLQQMTMAANAYKTQSGTSDKAIAEILIAGFTGQLKGWWDHLLTKQQQLDILDSIQKDENGALILDEFNSPIQDTITTLILTISLHFIGDPSHLRDKNAELLHNLRCRKLSEFQSYKTTFFTKLFLRDDANHITWKKKFLTGLPTLLGEKVKNSIKTLYDNRIPYDELTYGELVNFINKEASASKDCNGKCFSKPYEKHYKSKSHRKSFQEFREPSYKKPSRPYKRPNFSKKKDFRPKQKTSFNYKEATCLKCGRKGHTTKFCRVNRKLHELGLDEETLSKVAPLLVESSDSEFSMTGDSEPLQVDELIDSDTSVSSDSDSNTKSYLKKINVLTKEQETFLELVKHISDPNLQKEYLDKLLRTLELNKT
ncbi:hypothetical protein KPL70_021336 [Citrus sinensis]|nr:hypothetical protein KPL70_021336 [Citrus sinensis]